VLRTIAADIQVDRHASGGHFAYADGHVELVGESQINDWVNEGFDFAKPNQ
jgi:prepilin-type processing-associated H-X9-DG protein